MKRNTSKNILNSCKFETFSLLNILKAIYLDGIIGEFSIIIKDGIATIPVIDKSACLFAFARGCIGNIKDSKFGIKEGSFFVSILKQVNIQNIDFSVEDEKWLKLNLPGIGDIKLLLSPVDMIPTSIINYKGPMDAMKKSSTLSFTLDRDMCEKFLNFQNLVKNEKVVISVSGNDIFIGSGKYETKTFSINFGKLQKDVEPFSVSIVCSHISAILSQINWEEEKKPVMSISDGSPVLISHGDDFFWSLSPSCEN